MQGNEILKSQDVRKALAYGVDKEAIVKDVMVGEARVIHGPILPGYPGYNGQIEKFDYNPEKAQEILEGAGWKLLENSNIRTNKDKQELFLTITTVDNPEYVEIAEIIKKNWQSLGVKVKTEIVNVEQINKDYIRPKNYETLIFGEIFRG